jgi:hypothetical protein
MTDELMKRLRAMQSGGDLEGFLCAKIPEGRLPSGWLENGLLFKSLEGSIRSKKITTDYVVPADRFVRFVKELGHLAERRICFSIMGPPGVREHKLLLLIGEPCEKGSTQILAARFSSLTAAEICQIISSHLLGIQTSGVYDEPDLDYLERIRELLATGEARAALAVSISRYAKIEGTLFSEDHGDEPVEGLALGGGEISQLQPFAKPSIHWLNRTKKAEWALGQTTAIVIRGSDQAMACLCDRPRDLISFVELEQVSIEEIGVSLLLPLWIGKGDKIGPNDYGPHLVVVEGSTKGEARKEEPPAGPLDTDLESLAQELTSLELRIEEVSITNLSKRLTELEKRVDRIHDSVGHTSSDQKKMDATYANLEALIVHLQETSDRLDKASDEIRAIYHRLQEN